MKIVTIGDIHGRNIWKKIVRKEKDADKFIFIGDYFDSFSVPYIKQRDNFKDIVKFKMENPDKIILLIGNHDYHYLPFVDEHYSGYQNDNKDKIGELLNSCRYIMQIAYQYKDWLFTHAGVTEEWYTTRVCDDIDDTDVAQHINDMFMALPNKFKFQASTPLDNYGDSITQPPIWVRPRALISDKLGKWKQVVGHTHQKSIELGDDIYFIDTFDNCTEYLVIEDGVPSVKSI